MLLLDCSGLGWLGRPWDSSRLGKVRPRPGEAKSSEPGARPGSPISRCSVGELRWAGLAGQALGSNWPGKISPERGKILSFASGGLSLGWAGLGWAGLGCAGLGWPRLACWPGLAWVCLGWRWAGLRWPGLAWAAFLAWAGWICLGLPGLCWVGLRWPGRAWLLFAWPGLALPHLALVYPGRLGVGHGVAWAGSV